MRCSRFVARGDLTDAQWARLEPLLPRGKKPGRPPTWTKRQLIDGIRFRTRTGVPWRDVPERYGPWARVYDLFRRWQRDRTWQRIFTELQVQADIKGLINWEINVDSTVCRAHQHTAGARKKGPCKRNRPAVSPRRASVASSCPSGPRLGFTTVTGTTVDARCGLYGIAGNPQDRASSRSCAGGIRPSAIDRRYLP
ncbi:IS5 family transposase [Streptomyces sp. BK340]|uniref:IS5 family transposase n=1 Tax=Streptomyces sp. BK340 TaxID=2572903 RepID=UPI0021BDEC3C|nr:IS5 family transposase [Streptomyces sp. BK340]